MDTCEVIIALDEAIKRIQEAAPHLEEDGVTDYVRLTRKLVRGTIGLMQMTITMLENPNLTQMEDDQ